MAIAYPTFSSLDERQGIETRTFHRFAVLPPSDHHSCFLSLDVSTRRPAHFSTLTAISQASDQTDCCLPRHRQAVRLQCFCHWIITGCFSPLARFGLHRWEHAPLMDIACPVFSSFSLDESQWD